MRDTRRGMLALLAACAHHVAEPTPAGPAADEHGPSPLKVCWLEYATGTLDHNLVVARGALKRDVESTQSGILLVHPSGTWLVDGGMALETQRQLRVVPGPARLFLRQAASGWNRIASTAFAVQAAGFEPGSLTGAIPTHGHFDHLGGLVDLPGVPIHAPGAEIELARAAAAGKSARMLVDDARGLVARGKPLSFDGPPAMLWPSSHDLFGDGSVVLVPMPGHTPGSLGARIVLPNGNGVFLVGDAVWVREGYERREPKAWITTSFDSDRAGTDLQIQRLWALHEADPSLVILPSHDRRVWFEAFGQTGCHG